MLFERGRSPKEALKIGVRSKSLKVTGGRLHYLGNQPIELTTEEFGDIFIKQYIKYKKLKDPSPRDFFVKIKYDEAHKELGCTKRLRALQGEWLDINGNYYQVPEFPGEGFWHPRNYTPNEI